VTGCSAADYATIKYDLSGNELWIRRYNGPANDFDGAQAIALDGSGNVYVTGHSDGSGTRRDYATIKYDSNGTELWVRRYNGPGNGTDMAFDLAVDFSGNVYVTGVSGGSGTLGDYATIKYDSSGNKLWVKRYNGAANWSDIANAVALDRSGNVYLTGRSAQTDVWPYNYDYATIKYVQIGMRGDANGDGVIDIADVVYLINYLFIDGPAPVLCLDAGDANCDGAVNVADIIYLVNYLFLYGPPPGC